MDVKELQGIGLFSGLSKGELKRLGQWTDEVTVDEGYSLAKEGEFAYEFFVIEEGTADVIQGGNRLTELGPGEFFGEIGLLETERRVASVIATSPMRLIVMFQSQFRHMETRCRPLPTASGRRSARASRTHPRLRSPSSTTRPVSRAAEDRHPGGGGQTLGTPRRVWRPSPLRECH